MRKSISSMYFMTTTVLLLVSTAFMSLILMYMAMNYFKQQQEESLTEVVAIASNELLESGVPVCGLSADALLCQQLQQDLNLIGRTTSTILFVTDEQGVLTLTTGQEKYLGGQVKESVLRQTISQDGFFEAGTLAGLYEDRYYTAGQPVYMGENNELVGYVFASTAVQGLNEFIGDVFSGFVLSAGLMMLAASLLTIVFTNILTTPMRRISEAARKFGSGDFRVRVPVPASGTSEMAQLAETFNNMAHNLETIDSSRASFMGNIAHELRTPMTSIKGFIDGMLDGTIPQELQQHYLCLVSQEVGRLTRLIQNMLDISKLEAGEYRMNAQSYDVWDSITGVVFSAEQRIEQQKVQIEGLEPVNTTVYADPDLVYQVVYNIVDNALKFTPEGGTIAFGVQRSGNQVKVSIRNSGQGIAQDALPFVFDRFYKEDKSRGLNTKGSGLGLHICKVLVNRCGGEIWAESKEGEWCQFSFTLPCEAPGTRGKMLPGQKKA